MKTLGKIVKTHGLKGEVLVKLSIESHLIVEEIEVLFVESKSGIEPYFVESINLQSDRAFVKLEGIDDINAANKLKDLNVSVKQEVLAHEDVFAYEDLVGFQVKDDLKGDLGKVQDVYSTIAQDIIAMEYNGKEVLIPFVEEIVYKVEFEKKSILVNLPEGLLEVYFDENSSIPDDAD